MGTGGRRLTSVFFPRGDFLEFITEGTAFQRRHAGKLREIATVEKLYTDGMGIPHVRFSVCFEEPYRPPMTDGPRNLALRIFCERYQVRQTGETAEATAAA